MPPTRRKILLSVKDWSSEESIYTWKFLKSHLLQSGREGSWADELLVVHIARGKERERPWDHGSAVISDLQTALQPYTHDVYDLEGDAGPLIVDIATREQADILVLATRGRNAMQKAMLGSITDYVIQRVTCPCLVVKPHIGAGDTYRMKSAAQPSPVLQPYGSLSGSMGSAAAAAAAASARSAGSPGGSPMFGRLGSSLGVTPFNRRVAIVYDTTATGRFLLKWAADTILEPRDNVFVVRAVPKARHPSKSFADKNSVQRLASDALPNSCHMTTYNVQVSQQRGNRCRSVLSFVAKESADLLVIGVYMGAATGAGPSPAASGGSSRRKGLALTGNALTLANKCACSCLVVPMSEAALVAAAEAADLAITAEEEEALESGSEDSDTDEDGEPLTPHAAAAAADSGGEAGDGYEHHHGLSTSPPDAAAAQQQQHGGLATRGASAMKQIRAPLEALFKRRGSNTAAAGGGRDASAEVLLPAGLEARRAALLATLQGGGGAGGLPGGRYLVEVDPSGALRHIKPLAAAASCHHHHQHHQAGVAPLSIPQAADGDGLRVLTPASGGSLGGGGAAPAGAAPAFAGAGSARASKDSDGGAAAATAAAQLASPRSSSASPPVAAAAASAAE